MDDPLIPQQLRSFTPLNALTDAQWRQLRQQLVPRPLLAGQCLFRAGEQARDVYFLLSGELQVEGGPRLKAGTDEACHPVAPGSPRTCTVMAATDASVLTIDAAQLNRLLTWRVAYDDLLLAMGSEASDQEWLEALLENPIFSKVPPANVQQMLDRLHPVELAAGREVLTEGETGDCCYFLKRGRAEVIRSAGSQGQVLAELSVGSCFGEEALLSDQPRNATVTMLEEGCVLRLDRQDFFALLKAPVVDQVSLAEAARQLSQGARWLDVRLLEEYERSHASQALHMPLHLLRLKSRLLDPKGRYICYCDSGKRSGNAAFVLAELGFDACVLQDGLDALPAVKRDALLCESGAGYLLRRDGRVERSN